MGFAGGRRLAAFEASAIGSEATAGKERPMNMKPMSAEAKEERIRLRAYEIWCEEGMPEGRHEANWLRACEEIEADLREAAGMPAKKPRAAAAKPRVTKLAKPAKPSATILHS
jgi:hypothetical protein